MSTTRKIAHNTIVQIGGKIISTFLGLLAIGMMTRHLGQEQFGWYTTAMYFLQFIGIIIDFGMIPLTAQMMSEPHFEKQTLLRNLFTFRVVTALLFFVTIPFTILLFPYALEVKYAVAISAISFFSIALNQVLIGFLQYELKMHIHAMGEVLNRVVLIAGLWLLITNQQGFIPVIAAVSISSIVQTLYMYWRVNALTPIRFAYDKQLWKAIIVKMWPIAISIIFNVVYLKGDTIILSLVRAASEVGIYGAAYRVIDMLSQTAMLLMGILLPLLGFAYSRGDHQLFSKRYQQAFDSMMMLAIPMVVGTIALAKPIMILVAGEEFAASGRPLQILAIAVFGLYLGAIFGHVAVAVNQQKKTMWIYITTAILTLLGYLVVIPTFGMYGAAWMSVFSELFVGITLFVVVHRLLAERLSFVTFGKILLAATAMLIPIILLPNMHVLLLVMIGALVYATVLWITGVINNRLLKEIMYPRG